MMPWTVSLLLVAAAEGTAAFTERASVIPAMRNTTPNGTPTVVIEVALRRSTIQAISSHRIPETRNNHQ